MLQDFKVNFFLISFLHAALLWGAFSAFKSQESPLFKRNLQGASEIHLKLSQASQPILSRKKKLSSKKLQNPASLSPNDLQEEINFDQAVSTPKSLSQTEIESQRTLFKKELRAEIEKNKFYPSVSRRLGQSGVVEVAFTLLEDGHIIDVRLNRPSPFERLNQSALEAVRKVHLFRPIPKEWGEEKMDLLVSLKFMRN